MPQTFNTRRCFLGFLCNCIATCAGGQTSRREWFQLTSIVTGSFVTLWVTWTCKSTYQETATSGVYWRENKKVSSKKTKGVSHKVLVVTMERWSHNEQLKKTLHLTSYIHFCRVLMNGCRASDLHCWTRVKHLEFHWNWTRTILGREVQRS